MTERQGQMGFPGTRAAHQNDVVGSLQMLALGQIP
jgi:hypothetical protein